MKKPLTDDQMVALKELAVEMPHTSDEVLLRLALLRLGYLERKLDSADRLRDAVDAGYNIEVALKNFDEVE